MKKIFAVFIVISMLAAGFGAYAEEIYVIRNTFINSEGVAEKKQPKYETTWEEAEKIGDSVRGWSMNRPNGFLLSGRSVDETRIEFAKDGVTLSVYSEPLPQGYSYYDDLKMLRANYKDGDITERKSDNSFSFGVINDNEAVFIRRVWSEDKLITAACYSETENSALNEAEDCAVSLTAGFEKSAFDMSGAQDGYRRICVDGINFSMKVPADYRRLKTLTSGHLAEKRDV